MDDETPQEKAESAIYRRIAELTIDAETPEELLSLATCYDRTTWGAVGGRTDNHEWTIDLPIEEPAEPPPDPGKVSR